MGLYDIPGTNFYDMFAIPVGRIYTNVSVSEQRKVPSTNLIHLSFVLEDPLGYLRYS